MHQSNAWLSSQGIAALVTAVRQAPIERGMRIPPILIVASLPIDVPKGPLAPKFEGAEHKFAGLSAAYQETAVTLGCHFLMPVASPRPAGLMEFIWMRIGIFCWVRRWSVLLPPCCHFKIIVMGVIYSINPGFSRFA